MQAILDIFKALSDQTRLRIVNLLYKAKTELCVCEFVDALEESQYNISRHLKVLKQAGMINERKEGRWVYYALVKEPGFQIALLKALSSYSDESIKKDEIELEERLRLRENGKCLLGIQKKELRNTQNIRIKR